MWLLSESDVARVLDAGLAIQAVDAGLRSLSGGQTLQPLRTVLRLEPHGSFLGLMPAHMRDSDLLGLKIVTVAHGNPSLGLPSHLAGIMLLDPATGQILSFMDGRLITEVRTAAASAVSTRLLSRPESTSLAILGSGVQARSHLDCLLRVRGFKEVRVWSPTPAHREKFAIDESARHRIEVRAVAGPEEAARGADVIACCMSCEGPVLLGDWLSPGQHITAVGASQRATRELDGQAVSRCTVWVDQREAAQAEAGDLLQAAAESLYTESQLAGELGEALLGSARGRSSAEEITLFKSVGVAVEDVTTATLVYLRARALGFGQEFHLQA